MARLRRGVEDWVALIDEWREGGLSLSAFCERRGLNLGTMQGWVYKRGHRLTIEQARRQSVDPRCPAEDPPAVTFVPVHLATPIAAAGSGVEVVLGVGRRVVVAPGFDPETLRRVVAVLEDPPC